MCENAPVVIESSDWIDARLEDLEFFTSYILDQHHHYIIGEY